MKAQGWSSSVTEGYDGRSALDLCRQYYRRCNSALPPKNDKKGKRVTA